MTTNASYLVLGDDGNQYGPVTETELREWIREGRIHGHNQTWLQGSADWLPLAEQPLFRDSFATSSPPPPPPPPIRTKPPIARANAMPHAVPVAAAPVVGTGTIVCSYILALLMPLFGFFAGIYLLAKKQVGHGVTCMAISVFMFLFLLSVFNG